MSKKRSRAQFEKAQKVLNYESLPFERPRVYPVEPPLGKPKQYRDIDDEADMEWEVQKSKRPYMGFAMRRKIIELRFGSYGGQYERYVTRICDITKQLGLKQRQVSYTCGKYVSNGGFLMAHPGLMPRKRGPVKMTPTIVDYILDPKIMRAWAHLTLPERCTQIEIKFGLKITRRTLATWYQRNGVSKTNPQYKFLGHRKRPGLDKE